jgi:hypothetical protein
MADGNYPTWKTKDVVALLGWLDFCLQSNQDFDATIIEHLKESSKETSNDTFVVTKEQIDYQFSWLARKQSEQLKERIGLTGAEIRRQGSKCLDTFSKEMKNNIKISLSDYTTTYAEILLSRTSFQSPGHGITNSTGDELTSNPQGKVPADSIESIGQENVSNEC